MNLKNGKEFTSKSVGTGLSSYEKRIYWAAVRPPLWSSGQGFWLQIQRSRVRFPALPDFLSTRGTLSLVSLVRSIEELLE